MLLVYSDVVLVYWGVVVGVLLVYSGVVLVYWGVVVGVLLVYSGVVLGVFYYGAMVVL